MPGHETVRWTPPGHLEHRECASLSAGRWRSAFSRASYLKALVSWVQPLVVVGQADRHRSESLERHVAVVLAQETQEALVVRRLEVEALNQRFVVAPGAFESAAHDRPKIVGEIMRHI